MLLSLKRLFPGSGRSRRKWQPTPVLLPGESHAGRSLAGYIPWGCRELDTIEWLHFHFLFYRQCTFLTIISMTLSIIIMSIKANTWVRTSGHFKEGPNERMTGHSYRKSYAVLRKKKKFFMKWHEQSITYMGGTVFLFILFFKESNFDPFFPRNPWMETQLCAFHQSIDFYLWEGSKNDPHLPMYNTYC